MNALKTSFYFLLILILSGYDVIYAADCDNTGNQLQNGSFELANRDSEPTSWTVTASSDRNVSFLRSTGYQFCDDYYGLLTYTSAGTARVYQDVTLDPEATAVTLTIWGGIHDYCNAQFRLIFLDASGDEITSHRKTADVTKRVPGLQKYTLENEVPSGARKVRVEGRMNRTQSQNGNYLKMEAALLTFKTPGSLPVTLSGFKGRVSEGGVDLNWQTVQEHNSKTFDVLHSHDGISWENIAQISAKGSYDGVSDYTHQHVPQVAGRQYYRLKIVDLDGSFELSSILSLDFPGLESPGLSSLFYPNPTDGKIRLQDQAVGVMVYDITGRSVLQMGRLRRREELDLSHLRSGTYLIRWSDTAGRRFLQRVALSR